MKLEHAPVPALRPSEYTAALIQVLQANKEFIKGLFPSGLIYATLFDDDAQRVIGEVGPQTEGVKKMLTAMR